MIPKFRSWLENSGEEGSSLSEPVHKSGEGGLSTYKLVEKRIKEMIQELSDKGVATEEEINNSIKQFIDKNLKSKEESPSQDSSQQSDS